MYPHGASDPLRHFPICREQPKHPLLHPWESAFPSSKMSMPGGCWTKITSLYYLYTFFPISPTNLLPCFQTSFWLGHGLPLPSASPRRSLLFALKGDTPKLHKELATSSLLGSPNSVHLGSFFAGGPPCMAELCCPMGGGVLSPCGSQPPLKRAQSRLWFLFITCKNWTHETDSLPFGKGGYTLGS